LHEDKLQTKQEAISINTLGNISHTMVSQSSHKITSAKFAPVQGTAIKNNPQEKLATGASKQEAVVVEQSQNMLEAFTMSSQ
jgi:hypothetical protein